MGANPTPQGWPWPAMERGSRTIDAAAAAAAAAAVVAAVAAAAAAGRTTPCLPLPRRPRFFLFRARPAGGEEVRSCSRRARSCFCRCIHSCSR